jgi:hypothetical protein
LSPAQSDQIKNLDAGEIKNLLENILKENILSFNKFFVSPFPLNLFLLEQAKAHLT